MNRVLDQIIISENELGRHLTGILALLMVQTKLGRQEGGGGISHRGAFEAQAATAVKYVLVCICHPQSPPHFVFAT